MIILGIDPGTQHIGVCLYDSEARRVLASATLDAPEGAQWTPVTGPDAVEDWWDARDMAAGGFSVGLVAIERTEWRGMGGPSLLETTELVGALWQRYRLVSQRGRRCCAAARYSKPFASRPARRRKSALRSSRATAGRSRRRRAARCMA